MNKKYQWAIGTVLILLAIVGGYLFFLPEPNYIVTENDLVIEQEVDKEVEVDPATERIYKETVREVGLFSFQEETDRAEIWERLTTEEPLENNIIKSGELLGMRIIMESVEGVFIVETDILNEQGEEVVGIDETIPPVEVTGGGLINLCCFKTSEAGNFYVRTTIDGELAIKVPFVVEIE